MTFFAELKRRNVVRVGIAYVIVGWLLAQIAEFAADNFGAPDWVLKIFVVFVILGLPLALFFAWAFELTPEGIKLEKNVDRDESITPQTGRKLDFIIIAVMAIALIYMVADKFIGEPEIPEVTEAAAPADKSIAVLPFVNMSDDKDYFADGLSEELLNLLAKIPDLKVAGRTSSFAFKGKNDDLRAIGDALGVSTVLEGSVRRSGVRLRITAQLINVEDGFHIWSETYDREMADVFDIQDDVAAAILAALNVYLTDGRAPAAIRPTENIEAYELYLKSVGLATGGEEDTEQAIALLSQAIELDPGFAEAYELRGYIYFMVSISYMDGPTAFALAFEDANKALELNPDLIRAKVTRDSTDAENYTWLGEVEAVEWGLSKTPQDELFIDALAFSFNEAGYFREAESLLVKGIELNPLSSIFRVQYALTLNALGDTKRALEELRIVNSGQGLTGSGIAGAIHLLAGQDELAIEEFAKYIEFIGGDSSRARQLVELGRSAPDGPAKLAVELAENPLPGKAPSEHYFHVGLKAMDQLYDLLFSKLGEAVLASQADLIMRDVMPLRQSGFMTHPRFMSFAEDNDMIKFWDSRGPPDNCSKVDGNWFCE
jgi:TolB-like protein